MKKIPLTKGKLALVDDDDYEYLMQWKWQYVPKDGYARRTVNSKREKQTYIMHRIVNNTPDGLNTDHINGDRLDNRKCNLRTASNSQNQMNRGSSKGSSSKYKGVSWNKRDCVWRVRLGNKYLGSFDNEKEAAVAYNNGAVKHHGTFAKLNEVII